MTSNPWQFPRLTWPFDARVTMPGSKSVANRALVCAALATGHTRLTNATPCRDVELMVDGLATMGYDVAWRDRRSGIIDVHGGVPTRAGRGTVTCENAGTTSRFLLSIAAITPGEWILEGSERLSERPLNALVEALRQLGASLSTPSGRLPITVRGQQLAGGRCEVDVAASSQFLSSLMLIGPHSSEGLEVEWSDALPSSRYVELTAAVMAEFGARIGTEEGLATILGTGYTTPAEFIVEGDWSAAGAFLVLAELANCRFEGEGLSKHSRQADAAMPGIINDMREDAMRLVDVSEFPDQLMNLAVLAAGRRVPTRFAGAANLRLKECDRLAVITRELTRAGVSVEAHEDGLTVQPTLATRPATFDPQDDHRMVMATAIVGALGGGSCEGRECVEKSWPRFETDWEAALESPRCAVLVGMRGAGKTTLAAALAAETDRPHFDTDAIFVDRFGPIPDFVKREGWAAFRDREAQIIREVATSGHVVSVGGGAVESPASRAAIRGSRGVVFWLDEELPELRRRLEEDDGGRPSVSGRDLFEELEDLDLRRRPLYERLADFRLPRGLTTASGVSWVLDAVRPTWQRSESSDVTRNAPSD